MKRLMFCVGGKSYFCFYKVRKKEGVSYVLLKDDADGRGYSVMVAAPIILPLIRFEIVEPYENIVFVYISEFFDCHRLYVTKDGGVGCVKLAPSECKKLYW